MTRWSPVLPCQGWPRDPWKQVPPPNPPPCPGATLSEDLPLFWVHAGDRARVFLPLGVPPLTQSPRLANQVQPPPVRARFRALGENPRLPWPANHFNAFLKPERINPPPRGPSTAGLEDLLALWVEGQRRERWLLPLWVQRECRLPPRKSPFHTRPSACPNHEKTPYPSRNKQFSRLINCYKIYKNGGRGRSNGETTQTPGSRRPGGARGRLGDGLGNGHVPTSPSQLSQTCRGYAGRHGDSPTIKDESSTKRLFKTF